MISQLATTTAGSSLLAYYAGIRRILQKVATVKIATGTRHDLLEESISLAPPLHVAGRVDASTPASKGLVCDSCLTLA